MFQKWTWKEKIKYTPEVTNEDIENMSESEWSNALAYYEKYYKKQTPLWWRSFSRDEGLTSRVWWIPKDFWGMLEFFGVGLLAIVSFGIGNVIVDLFF